VPSGPTLRVGPDVARYARCNNGAAARGRIIEPIPEKEQIGLLAAAR
jgi:hypothetical protein